MLLPILDYISDYLIWSADVGAFDSSHLIYHYWLSAYFLTLNIRYQAKPDEGTGLSIPDVTSCNFY